MVKNIIFILMFQNVYFLYSVHIVYAPVWLVGICCCHKQYKPAKVFIFRWQQQTFFLACHPNTTFECAKRNKVSLALTEFSKSDAVRYEFLYYFCRMQPNLALCQPIFLKAAMWRHCMYTALASPTITTIAVAIA